eukprot:COSAG05_NODE_18396_length_309_cov_0.680952_1_plen_91_part_01
MRSRHWIAALPCLVICFSCSRAENLPRMIPRTRKGPSAPCPGPTSGVVAGRQPLPQRQHQYHLLLMLVHSPVRLRLQSRRAISLPVRHLRW